MPEVPAETALSARTPGWLTAVAALNLTAWIAFRHSAAFFWMPSWLDGILSITVLLAVMWVRWPGWQRRAAHAFWERRELTLVGGLMVAAFAIRRAGLYFGLPFCYGVDEPAVVGPSLRIISTGDLNPHFFHYPSLGFYITSAVIALGYLREAASGLCAHIADMPEWIPYYYARWVSCIASALTVPAVYLLGRRACGRIEATLGAALLAVSHLASESARNAGFHSMAPLVVVLTLVVLLGYLEKQNHRWAVAAGCLAGMAVSTMYYAAALVPLALGVVFAATPGRRWRQAALVSAAVLLGFLLFTPYAVFDLAGFLNQFGERMHMAARATGWGMGALAGGTARNYAIGYVAAFGWLAAVLFVLEALVAMARFDPQRIVLALFVILHLAWVGSYPSGFGRYMGPAEPVYLLLAAGGLVRLCRWLWARKQGWMGHVALVLGTLFLFSSPARRQIQWVRQSAAPIACADAQKWLTARARFDDVILREERTPWLPPAFKRCTAVPRIVDQPADESVASGLRYVLISRSIYTRTPESDLAYRRWLRRAGARPVYQVTGNDGIANPTIEIYELR